MNRRQKVSALILSRRNIGEADRIVTLFTREHGLWRAMAKGVRRIPSRRGGHLEPFTRVLAVISGKEMARYVEAVETVEHYPDLQQDELAFDHARTLGMIVTNLFGEEQRVPELFDALDHAWEMLPTLPATKKILMEIAVALHALRFAGVMPELQNCTRCGQEKPTEAVVFEAQEGGWHCLVCHQGFEGAANSLIPRLLPVVRFLAAKPQQALRVHLEDTESLQLLSAMRTYMSHVVGKPMPVLTPAIEQTIFEQALAYGR